MKAKDKEKLQKAKAKEKAKEAKIKAKAKEKKQEEKAKEKAAKKERGVKVSVNVDVHKIVASAGLAGVLIVGIVYGCNTYRKMMQWRDEE